MSDEQRKATDILLDIENQIKILSKLIYNQDTNIKLILAKLNDTKMNIPTIQVENQDEEENFPEFSMELDESPTGKRRTSRSQETKSSAGKIPVFQKVVDNTNKDIFMAEVVIYDKATGKIVQKTKTSAVGKWQTALEAGIYLIKISKNDAVSKKILECSQEIEVSAKENPFKLQTIIMKR